MKPHDDPDLPPADDLALTSREGSKLARYVRHAREAIADLLTIENACVWPEVEAKLGEPELDKDGFHPNVLAKARDELLAEGTIFASEPTATRGTREIVVYSFRPTPGLARRIEDASGRKRLLQARYTGWGQPSARHARGLIGPAGERVMRASLRDPSLDRLYLPVPQGEVTHLFGAPLPGGSLDDAAVHLGVRGGTPQDAIWVTFEVKNVRHWLYPRHARVYQLLDKAARLVIAHPDRLFVPVLVCRRRHYWLRQMGVDLGFMVIETRRQFISGVKDLKPEALEEVRKELGYHFLQVDDGADDRLRAALIEGLPPFAVRLAERWARYAPSLADLFTQLRRDGLADRTRMRLLSQLRTRARGLEGTRVDW